MERRVVITDCDHVDLKQEEEVFRRNQVEFEFLDCGDTGQLIRKLKGVKVIANQYTPLTEQFFDETEDLELVVRYGVGVNHIDIDAATRNHVIVCNVPDYGVQEVAAHALAMMMGLTRKIYHADRAMRQGRWAYEECIPICRLSGLTVGIIGLGRIGTCLAEIIKGLGCRVIACDVRSQKRVPEHVTVVPFEQLLRESDMISIHTPLETSRGLIGLEELKLMKKNAVLINVSRGGIIDEQALVQALREHWIAGAGLDVFEKEPVGTENPLMAFDNVIFSPHMAWYSEQASVDLKRKLAEELVRYLDGEPLQYRLN
ncbi:C-terminal binding protein [Clostridium sp. AN503]|uniref:C-terminal binding protein n=1 Tax=Clostridium sp. AN503 TaxID=3160598 RepID=UPI003459E093